MTVDTNGQGHVMFRCKHRGEGCPQARRSNKEPLRAALLGLRLIAHDEGLQAAIREELEAGRRASPEGGRRSRRTSEATLNGLLEQRRKLLRLHHEDQISAELFAEEEGRLTRLIDAARAEGDREAAQGVELERPQHPVRAGR